jgi:hypothetical protein
LWAISDRTDFHRSTHTLQKAPFHIQHTLLKTAVALIFKIGAGVLLLPKSNHIEPISK